MIVNGFCNIVHFLSCHEFYRNTRYFYQIFFCQKERIFPFFPEFHPRKREISFGKSEFTLRFQFWAKRILFFEDGILGKREKFSLSDKKYLTEIPCITVELVTGKTRHYNLSLVFLFLIRLWNRKLLFQNYLKC